MLNGFSRLVVGWAHEVSDVPPGQKELVLGGQHGGCALPCPWIQVGLSSVPAALTVSLPVAQAWSGWRYSEFKHCSTLLVLYLPLTGQPCVHTPQYFDS